MSERNLTSKSTLMPNSLLKIAALISLLTIVAFPLKSQTPPWGAWQRISAEPIMRPGSNDFEWAGVFNPGVVLFDRNDPTRVLSRSEKPIFVVEKEWEKIGQVPNVVFVSGMVRDGNRWLFYYGAADSTLAWRGRGWGWGWGSCCGL